MDLLLAEELLLLVLDDQKGSSWNTMLDTGLAGALLVDLGRVGALRTTGKQLQPVAGASPDHPLLARALEAVVASSKPRSAETWIGRLPRDLKPIAETVARGLVERGILAEERTKVLGLFPTTRFPEADPGPERLLRSRLRAVLLGQREPTERDALLLGLLVPLDLVTGLVGKPDRRAAKARAKEIADGGVAGSAVHDAIQQEIMTAVLPALAATTVASSPGS